MSIEHPDRNPWRGFKDRPFADRLRDWGAILLVVPIAVVGAAGLKAKDAIRDRLSRVNRFVSSANRVVRERIFKFNS